jgi:hypothetical protein
MTVVVGVLGGADLDFGCLYLLSIISKRELIIVRRSIIISYPNSSLLLATHEGEEGTDPNEGESCEIFFG